MAQRVGRLRRNFQGYTDDPAEVLIGVGASSISRFPQGYAQNAPATSKHTAAIREGRFSTARGHAFRGDDLLRGRIIEALMCDFEVRTADLTEHFDVGAGDLRAMFEAVNGAFEGLLEVSDEGLVIPKEARPLTRMIAKAFDAYEMTAERHSSAI